MKHYFFGLFLLCLACNANSGKSSANQPASDKTLELKVRVIGFANDYLKLAGVYGDQNFIVDSALADAHGNAVFKRDSTLPGGMYFVLYPDKFIAQLLIDKDQHFAIEFDPNDVVNSMKISGSLDNELLYKNLKFEAVHGEKINAAQQKLNQSQKGTEEYKQYEAALEKLINERKAHIKWFVDNYPDAFFTKFKVAGQNPDPRKPLKPDGTIDEQLQVYYYRNDYWNDYDFSDERLLRTPVYFNKLKKYIKDFTPQVPDSIIKYADLVTMKSKANKEVFKFTANWIALQYREAKILGRESVYVFMIEKYWTKDQAFWSDEHEIQRIRAQAMQMKPSLIGQIGQNVTGINEYGQTVSLYDIKTPFVVVYIFSYDCENCKKETPKLMNVYNEWKNKGLDIFSICLDGDREKWKAYLKQNNMTFRNIFDPNNETGFRLKYYVDITPEIYLLDKDRKIIASNIDSESLRILLERESKKIH